MHYRNGKRYYTMAQYCGERYGGRIVKIPLDWGSSCPNRDGTCSVGGCSFCLFPNRINVENISEQYNKGLARLAGKWPGARPVAYLQQGSNTHHPPQRLRALLEETARLPGLAGIRIATRADCVDPERVEILDRVRQESGLPVEIELGLQTAFDGTAAALNRGHSFEAFCQGFTLLRERRFYLCVHLINGLPGETPAQMCESVRRVAALYPDGVKLHMLHLLRGTLLAQRYQREPFPLLEREEYVAVVCEQIGLLPPDVVIERLTGDGAADALIAPLWTRDKRRVLNAIDRELVHRDITQGSLRGRKETV